tara:strand:- start:318 stop:515 length:198 start_codon:yes stop_codon:yes gene_type:complete
MGGAFLFFEQMDDCAAFKPELPRPSIRVRTLGIAFGHDPRYGFNLMTAPIECLALGESKRYGRIY